MIHTHHDLQKKLLLGHSYHHIQRVVQGRKPPGKLVGEHSLTLDTRGTGPSLETQFVMFFFWIKIFLFQKGRDKHIQIVPTILAHEVGTVLRPERVNKLAKENEQSMGFSKASSFYTYPGIKHKQDKHHPNKVT